MSYLITWYVVLGIIPGILGFAWGFHSLADGDDIASMDLPDLGMNLLFALLSGVVCWAAWGVLVPVACVLWCVRAVARYLKWRRFT